MTFVSSRGRAFFQLQIYLFNNQKWIKWISNLASTKNIPTTLLFGTTFLFSTTFLLILQKISLLHSYLVLLSYYFPRKVRSYTLIQAYCYIRNSRVVNVKSMRKIFWNFACFSENPNFTAALAIFFILFKLKPDITCTRINKEG